MSRFAADIAWLQRTFDAARAANASAVMLITRADPGFDPSDPTRAALRENFTRVGTFGDNQANGNNDVHCEPHGSSGPVSAGAEMD